MKTNLTKKLSVLVLIFTMVMSTVNLSFADDNYANELGEQNVIEQNDIDQLDQEQMEEQSPELEQQGDVDGIEEPLTVDVSDANRGETLYLDDFVTPGEKRDISSLDGGIVFEKGAIITNAKYFKFLGTELIISADSNYEVPKTIRITGGLSVRNYSGFGFSSDLKKVEMHCVNDDTNYISYAHKDKDGTHAVFNTPERTGYNMDVYKDPECTDHLADLKKITYSTLNQNLYVKFTPIEYNVEFDMNGGPGSKEDIKDVKYDTPIESAKFDAEYSMQAYEKCVFAGWSTDPNAVPTEILDTSNGLSNLRDTAGTVTLYAIWNDTRYKLESLEKPTLTWSQAFIATLAEAQDSDETDDTADLTAVNRYILDAIFGSNEIDADGKGLDPEDFDVKYLSYGFGISIEQGISVGEYVYVNKTGGKNFIPFGINDYNVTGYNLMKIDFPGNQEVQPYHKDGMRLFLSQFEVEEAIELEVYDLESLHNATGQEKTDIKNDIERTIKETLVEVEGKTDKLKEFGEVSIEYYAGNLLKPWKPIDNEIGVSNIATDHLFGQEKATFGVGEIKKGNKEDIRITLTTKEPEAKTLQLTTSVSVIDSRKVIKITPKDELFMDEVKYYEGRQVSNEEICKAVISKISYKDADDQESFILGPEYDDGDLSRLLQEKKLRVEYWALDKAPTEVESTLLSTVQDLAWIDIEVLAAADDNLKKIIDTIKSLGGFHYFGESKVTDEHGCKQEFIRITYIGDSQYTDHTINTIVWTEDIRTQTYITGQETFNTTYGNEDLDSWVRNNNMKVVCKDEQDQPVEISVDPSSLILVPTQDNIDAGVQEVKVRYRGNDTYKPAEKTITVTVNKKKTEDFEVESKTVDYVNAPYNINEKGQAINIDKDAYQTDKDIDYFYIIAGVDAETSGFISVGLPQSIRSSMNTSTTDIFNKIISIFNPDDKELTVDTYKILENLFNETDEAISYENFEKIINLLIDLVPEIPSLNMDKDALKEVLKVVGNYASNRVKIKLGVGPTAAGLYMTTAVVTDKNYTTKIATAPLVINQGEGQLKFSNEFTGEGVKTLQLDSEKVQTLVKAIETIRKLNGYDDDNLSQIVDKILPTISKVKAYVLPVDVAKTQDFATEIKAEYTVDPDTITNLYVGTKSNGKVVVSETPVVEPGVYMQLAFTILGNTKTDPISRIYVVEGKASKVQLQYNGQSKLFNIVKKGGEEIYNAKVLGDDNMELTGDVKITYKGLFRSYDTMPTKFGIYRVTATYDGDDTYRAASTTQILIVL